jgi:hypothetical protein
MSLYKQLFYQQRAGEQLAAEMSNGQTELNATSYRFLFDAYNGYIYENVNGVSRRVAITSNTPQGTNINSKMIVYSLRNMYGCDIYKTVLCFNILSEPQLLAYPDPNGYYPFLPDYYKSLSTLPVNYPDLSLMMERTDNSSLEELFGK